MAGNRRHAGSMDSAMANLKRIDGQIAAGRARCAAEHPVAPLTKREAIERYAKLRDSALGFVPSVERARRLAEVASPEELMAFSKATGHLSWPESYGQTPWETASVAGFGLRSEAEHPERTHWAHEMLEAYRLGRRALQGERGVPEDRAATDRAGVTPRKPPRDRGEVAILAVARQIGRERPDDIMLVLAEDQSFGSPQILVGKPLLRSMTSAREDRK